MKKNGFTLVELSIVIVIIGFLVAGISAGTQLVKSAQLMSVISDIEQLELAYSGFISKYGYKPGDHPAAESLFPTCGPLNPPPNPNACNGNGDGIIRWGNGGITDISSADAGDEGLKAMQTLFLSGLYNKTGTINDIDADYRTFEMYMSPRFFPVLSGDSSNTIVVTSGGDSLFWYSTPNVFPLYTTAVYITNAGVEIGSDFFLNGGLPAMESFQIDEKIDDATIDSGGNFIGAETGNFRAIQGGLNGGTLSSTCKTANVYETTTTGKACIIGKKTSIQ